MVIHKNVRIVVILLAVLLTTVSGFAYWRYRQLLSISSFSECVTAGFPVMESYPEVCRTSDGRNFIRQVQNQDITVSGQFTCLPHKDTSGPQTLECAFGLEDENGDYYALSDPELEFLTDLTTGQYVTITGTLQTSVDSKYAVVGIILISHISEE